MLKLQRKLFRQEKRLKYAQLMMTYILKLLNLENEFSEVIHAISQGRLGIKRPCKTSLGYQLTLEQTVHADAAAKFTGITAISNSESAIDRWMITRQLKSEIVSTLFESSAITTLFTNIIVSVGAESVCYKYTGRDISRIQFNTAVTKQEMSLIFLVIIKRWTQKLFDTSNIHHM